MFSSEFHNLHHAFYLNCTNGMRPTTFKYIIKKIQLMSISARWIYRTVRQNVNCKGYIQFIKMLYHQKISKVNVTWRRSGKFDSQLLFLTSNYLKAVALFSKAKNLSSYRSILNINSFG